MFDAEAWEAALVYVLESIVEELSTRSLKDMYSALRDAVEADIQAHNNDDDLPYDVAETTDWFEHEQLLLAEIKRRKHKVKQVDWSNVPDFEPPW